MDQANADDGCSAEKHDEDARTLRDGDSIERLQSEIHSIDGAIDDLDELFIELLERVERLESRVRDLEGHPQRTNARVIEAEQLWDVDSNGDLDFLTGDLAPTGEVKERIDVAHSGGPK